MKTVEIKKDYQHTARRTWKKGETPTVSSQLADELVKKGIARVINEGDTRRGIDENQWEEMQTPETKKQIVIDEEE